MEKLLKEKPFACFCVGYVLMLVPADVVGHLAAERWGNSTGVYVGGSLWLFLVAAIASPMFFRRPSGRSIIALCVHLIVIGSFLFVAIGALCDEYSRRLSACEKYITAHSSPTVEDYRRLFPERTRGGGVDPQIPRVGPGHGVDPNIPNIGRIKLTEREKVVESPQKSVIIPQAKEGGIVDQ